MITTALIIFLVSILATFQVFVPVINYNNYKKQRDYDEEVRLYKLKVIKTFYPVLHGMTYAEINEKYGISKVYDTVGKAYLQKRNIDRY